MKAWKNCPDCGKRIRSYNARCKPCSYEARRLPPYERLIPRVRVEGECWIWTGSFGTRGYGQIGGSRGRPIATHRVTYEHHHGPIPPGMHVDHLCANKACCNPDHLEAVTPAENVARQVARRRSLSSAATAEIHF